MQRAKERAGQAIIGSGQWERALWANEWACDMKRAPHCTATSLIGRTPSTRALQGAARARRAEDGRWFQGQCAKPHRGTVL
ncbi:hypothetical protein GGTG_06865 [Gaeumannomyces tritici R3-111a-1]|uniref:Uncharacterized protein n=1 Tax=Gaeumannomyces tritici (strain R3-111a-1) TaxID=644352 RepID=J3P018_GAET3|nr:hypothetical protein GGTG_06865 [Gaeumannomyces tritici R3-111a-1]EJT76951.1 hypothetical protein GGTG_06865 [Gaeumannomyces tritici R3-111a-1]